MERFICIHGHFYQPPRENPCLGAIEVQDSAYPYHDWNERVTAECYAPNSASRVLDGDGKITGILNNYSKISFNFGPTLLSWMERYTPDVYRAILEADRESVDRFSGHGNAIAQSYNHMIMPLANRRDKKTQITWGIEDFRQRFKRFPEGMWLPETAVDVETLGLLSEAKIKYVILAPHQAWRVRKIGSGKWKDVSGARIDPTRAYLCRLPGGGKVVVFFYDGPISRAVAFENLLRKGEDFMNRLTAGFSETRTWPQIVSIATDGETYGHHHHFGDMALAYTLNFIESNHDVKLTNYGEYLEKYPPSHEVQIYENSSWSCSHGVERWRNHCGCALHNNGWSQHWRKPLRETFDWLRDELSRQYEALAGRYFYNPWGAREEYIGILLDCSEEHREAFFRKHVRAPLTDRDRVTAVKLLECQRLAMLMYTSCGWFFDELSGIETVQVIQYAGMALQLAWEVSGSFLEEPFLERLGAAKSNLPEYGDGKRIYEKFVKPSMVDFKKVAAHYSMSSLFRDYGDSTDVYRYHVEKDDFTMMQVGITKFAVGRIRVSSRVTGEQSLISFCVLSLGGHALNGGVRDFLGEGPYREMKEETTQAFQNGAFAEIVRLMDKHFGMHNYTLTSLFRDEQREIIRHIIAGDVENVHSVFQDIYEKNRVLAGFLGDMRMPVPEALVSVAGIYLGEKIKKAFSEEYLDGEKTRATIAEIQRWNARIDLAGLEFIVRRRGENMMEKLSHDLSNETIMKEMEKLVTFAAMVPLEVNMWQTQNIYCQIVHGDDYKACMKRAVKGDDEAASLIESFHRLGDMLYFNVNAVIPREVSAETWN